VEFKYADSLSGWEWRTQSCSVYADNESGARKECIKIYGLGVDCNYQITKVTME
jgi:hypothetical protein